MLSSLILASLLVMSASLVGVVTVWKRAGAVLEKNADFLISFSAGVFLVVAYRVSKEATEHAQSFGTGLFWIFFGALAVWVLFKLLPVLHSHPDHEHSVGEPQSIDIRRMLIGDGFHNMGDGIFLAASFAISPTIGIAAALSVFVHELIQEISEFFVLRSAGYSARQALVLNFMVSSTVLVGSLGSFFLIDAFELLEAPLLGLAGGAFLVVVLHDLIPHSIRSSSERLHYVKHFIWFIIGVAIMVGITALSAH